MRTLAQVRAGVDLIEDIEWIVETSAPSLAAAARRVGMQPDSLDQALRRLDRYDLLAKLISRNDLRKAS